MVVRTRVWSIMVLGGEFDSIENTGSHQHPRAILFNTLEQLYFAVSLKRKAENRKWVEANSLLKKIPLLLKSVGSYCVLHCSQVR